MLQIINASEAMCSGTGKVGCPMRKGEHGMSVMSITTEVSGAAKGSFIPMTGLSITVRITIIHLLSFIERQGYVENRNNTRMTDEYREFILKRMNGAVRSKSEFRHIKLNGARMRSVQKAHAYISRKLSFPAYYGNNLDALYDLLCSISDPTELTIKNASKLSHNLGDYAEALLKTFRDAKTSNTNLNFIEQN